MDVTSGHAAESGSAFTLIRKLAIDGVLLLWLALLAGMLGRYAWPLDLFAHFRAQYFVLFAVLATALLFMQRRSVAIFAFIGAVVSAVPIVGYVAQPTTSAAASTETFRLVSLNVWFRNHDYPRIASFLNDTGADAIVLQEASKPAALKIHALLPSYPYAHIDEDWHGAVVFSKWPLIAAASRPLTVHGSRAAQVQIDWRGSVLSLLGVHLHWPLGPRNVRLRNEELSGIASFAAGETGPLLVAGDFNISAWSGLFQDAVAQSGLNDCGSGQGLEPSWPSHIAWLGIRIDHCLASRHWRVIDLRIGPHVGSDHRPLIIELALENSEEAEAASR